MPVANTSFSYDPDLDHDIHLVLSKLARRDRSAYLRSAIRFYEANKNRFEADAIASQLGQVLELVKEIDRKLDQGDKGPGLEDGQGNDYLVKMAGQMDELFR